MKKIIYLCISLLISGCLIATTFSQKLPTDYGVFIGIDSENLDVLYDYKQVVIDAAYFSKAQIDTLHEKDILVYSYINLGAIENFRTYYENFADITLSDYENWPEERWIDVSNKEWQDFFIHTLAKNLIDKGIDGLFIDNIDIYHLYPTEAIYHGIKDTLLGLKETYNHIPIIINGGYEFIQTSLENNYELTTMLDGINQESVFSAIDFENHCLIENSLEERNWLLDYFKQIQKYNIDIYIIEYTTSPSLIKKLQAYYKHTNYTYYISSDIELQ